MEAVAALVEAGDGDNGAVGPVSGFDSVERGLARPLITGRRVRTVPAMTGPSPSQASSPTPDDVALTDTSEWPAFLVCVGVGALTILDLSGVNVALPSIEHALHADPTELQLIVAGYALAFGLSLVPAGRLGDMRSRRIMFLVGVLGFVGASALCAVAPDNVWLTVTRFLQGIAAGTQMPQVLGMVQQLFQGKQRGRAFGVFGSMIGVATALGPTIGGALIALGGQANGWRLLFVLNVPLGLAAAFFAFRLLPRKQDRDATSSQLDIVGVALFGATILCLMLPFLLTTGSSADDPLRWWWLAGVPVFGGVFAAWETHYKRRGKSPIIHFELFTRASYRNGVFLATAYFAALPASFLVTTLYLQEGLHISPLFAGMVTVPFALTSGTSAWIGGRIVLRYGRGLVVIGVLGAAVGLGLLLAAATLPPPGASEWCMAAAMLVAGAGGGLVVSPNQTLTLSDVPVTQGSIAGSMAQLGQRIGTAVGVALVTSAFFSAVSSGSAGPELVRYHDAFRDGFYVSLALTLAALGIGLLDLRARRRS